MLMVAVVHPDAFAPAHFSTPGYRDQAEMFFRGVESNGLILVDPDSRLLAELGERIAALPTKQGQQLQIRFAEMHKRKKQQKVATVCRPACPAAAGASLLDIAVQVRDACGADTLVVDSASHMALTTGAPGAEQTTPLSEYITSRFEERRRYFLERLPSVDRITPAELDELIVRATRFSRWLRFYDKQIGKGKNLSHFRRGIERVLRLWLANAHYPHAELQAELYTCVDDTPRKEMAESVAYHRVRADLVECLQRELGLRRFDFHFKHDPDGICHARFLQSQMVALSFDRGFDFINEEGSIRRNFVKIDSGCLEHLQEYRQLPLYKPAS